MTKVVKPRREALSLDELFGVYMRVHDEGGHIGDVAKELNRPLTSITQRVMVLRKHLKEVYGKELPKLARRPRTGGGRVASVVAPDNKLLGNLAALD